MKLKKQSTFALLFFLVLVLMSIGRFAFKKSSAFGLKNICSNLAPREEWHVPPSDTTLIKAILSQPFFYVGNSANTYLFLSEDKRYILKFFKMKHLIGKKWNSKQKVQKKNQKLEHIFAACKKNKNADLIFMHLNKSSDLKHKVVVRDKKNKWHRIPIDNVPFTLQEKLVN